MNERMEQTTSEREKAIMEKALLFWNSDLEDIEGEFLEEGQTIIDLPLAELDARVPSQGTVLLGRVAYLPKDD